MKALVTGGGGFLGQAIVRGLRQRGASVRSFSRNPHRALQDLAVEQRQGDLADRAAVEAAVEGCDVVFHVGAKAGVWGPYRDFHQANVVGTQNVVNACRRHRVGRLIYTSSPSVVFTGRDLAGIDESAPYPARFGAAYPETKAKAEQCVKEANSSTLATVTLRPYPVWGPGDVHILPRLASRAAAGRLWRIGRERKLIDTTYIENAAEAHLLAAERVSPGAAIAGRVYFISQGEPREVWEMINLLLAAAGAPTAERTIPRSLALMAAWSFEMLHRLTRNPAEPTLTRFLVRELSASHWVDLTAARRDLGYVPRVSIAEGLRLLKNARVGRSRS